MAQARYFLAHARQDNDFAIDMWTKDLTGPLRSRLAGTTTQLEAPLSVDGRLGAPMCPRARTTEVSPCSMASWFR